jgi:hypothetical protein
LNQDSNDADRDEGESLEERRKEDIRRIASGVVNFDGIDDHSQNPVIAGNGDWMRQRRFG